MCMASCCLLVLQFPCSLRSCSTCRSHCFSAGEIAKPNTPAKPLPAGAGDEAIAHLDKLRNAQGNLRTAEIRRNMQVRRQLRLHRARAYVDTAHLSRQGSC